LGWDVWNKPDNGGGGDYAGNDPGKFEHVALLLPGCSSGRGRPIPHSR
jgi:hypothetical protein